jgi:hypothetical protein
MYGVKNNAILVRIDATHTSSNSSVPSERIFPALDRDSGYRLIRGTVDRFRAVRGRRVNYETE